MLTTVRLRYTTPAAAAAAAATAPRQPSAVLSRPAGPPDAFGTLPVWAGGATGSSSVIESAARLGRCRDSGSYAVNCTCGSCGQCQGSRIQRLAGAAPSGDDQMRRLQPGRPGVVTSHGRGVLHLVTGSDRCGCGSSCSADLGTLARAPGSRFGGEREVTAPPSGRQLAGMRYTVRGAGGRQLRATATGPPESPANRVGSLPGGRGATWQRGIHGAAGRHRGTVTGAQWTTRVRRSGSVRRPGRQRSTATADQHGGNGRRPPPDAGVALRGSAASIDHACHRQRPRGRSRRLAGQEFSGWGTRLDECGQTGTLSG